MSHVDDPWDLLMQEESDLESYAEREAKTFNRLFELQKELNKIVDELDLYRKNK